MKTYRVSVAVLAVLVVLVSGLCLSCGKKTAPEPPKEMWHTNTVELWHTNTVERWRTNTVQVQHTNTVVQTVTNEVVKEVPAKLSAQEQRAAVTGFKYLSAPVVEGMSNPLYKASPVTMEVNIDNNAASVLGADVDVVKRSLDFALRAKNIPLADQSPYHLILDVTAPWTAEDPRVAILELKLNLKENATVDRGGDLIKCPAVVWSTPVSRLVWTVAIRDEARNAVNSTVDLFAKDWLQAKEQEGAVQSKIPAVPRGLLQ